MQKVALVMMCLILCVVNWMICDPVLAGPLENAGEFQKKIVEREEGRASSTTTDESSDNIEWKDSNSSINTDSTDQAAQQDQQQEQW